jgi:predicted phosphodiesterase
MKIAVISDTHDRVPVGLSHRLIDAGEIWHLGDVCHPNTLLSIEALGIRMRIISGNCDYLNLWPGAMGVTVGGLRFHLEHIAPRVTPTSSSRATPTDPIGKPMAG